MKLYMKEKIFSLKNKFTIKDEFENDCYFIEGELFSFGHNLHISNSNNEEIALVKEKLLAFNPKYEVYIHGEYQTTINKKMTFIKDRLTLDNLDWEVTGDILDRNYTIVSNDNEIASIKRALLSWGGNYEIDIHDANKKELILAIVLAIESANSDETAATI